MFFLPKSFDNLLHIFLSLPFVLLIINVAKGRTLFSFESKFFRWLGNISYGMYMYHMFIAGGIIYLFKDLSASNFIFNIIIYILIIGLTILVSHFSLRFIERPFLILKGKFTVVKSGVKD
jgi:peptidoglycan/LPS O-acetylase OafA/YrhL